MLTWNVPAVSYRRAEMRGPRACEGRRPGAARHGTRRWGPAAAVASVTLAATILAGCTTRPAAPSPTARTPSATATASAAGIEADIGKIKHVVIIMQENRSFDSFFGTYPGADGIPAKNGQFTVCVPDPRTKGCDKPYHDPSPVNGGAGHNLSDSIADVDGGKMD